MWAGTYYFVENAWRIKKGHRRQGAANLLYKSYKIYCKTGVVGVTGIKEE